MDCEISAAGDVSKNKNRFRISNLPG